MDLQKEQQLDDSIDPAVLRKLNALLKIQMGERKDRVEDIVDVPSAKGTVLLIRGFGSWPDDQTFKTLEQALEKNQYRAVRYSYHHPLKSHYWPMDTLNDLGECVERLSEKIKLLTTENKNKVVVMGHSLGGLILMDWLARYTLTSKYQELLSRVKKVYFFASPIFKDVPGFLKIKHPFFRKEYLYPVNYTPPFTKELLTRFSNISNYFCKEDELGPTKNYSFNENRILEGDPESVDEQAVEASHFDICNSVEVVDSVIADLNALGRF
jgi:pimeloyl-ACP methyl ester carboxylesterase